MSEYENVIAGKLRLKGKALDVKAGGITKKKKQRKNIERFITEKTATDLVEIINTEKNVDSGNEVSANYGERLTPAERRYLEQWKQLEVRRLLKIANESHRDRVQRFNQYLANLSDHYDIPKVGPG